MVCPVFNNHDPNPYSKHETKIDQESSLMFSHHIKGSDINIYQLHSRRLPHRIRVLVGSHGALIDGLLRPRAHVVDQDGAVVQAHGQHRRVRGVPVLGMTSVTMG